MTLGPSTHADADVSATAATSEIMERRHVLRCLAVATAAASAAAAGCSNPNTSEDLSADDVARLVAFMTGVTLAPAQAIQVRELFVRMRFNGSTSREV